MQGARHSSRDAQTAWGSPHSPGAQPGTLGAEPAQRDRRLGGLRPGGSRSPGQVTTCRTWTSTQRMTRKTLEPKTEHSGNSLRGREPGATRRPHSKAWRRTANPAESCEAPRTPVAQGTETSGRRAGMLPPANRAGAPSPPGWPTWSLRGAVSAADLDRWPCCPRLSPGAQRPAWRSGWGDGFPQDGPACRGVAAASRHPPTSLQGLLVASHDRRDTGGHRPGPAFWEHGDDRRQRASEREPAPNRPVSPGLTEPSR